MTKSLNPEASQSESDPLVLVEGLNRDEASLWISGKFAFFLDKSAPTGHSLTIFRVYLQGRTTLRDNLSIPALIGLDELQCYISA